MPGPWSYNWKWDDDDGGEVNPRGPWQHNWDWGRAEAGAVTQDPNFQKAVPHPADKYLRADERQLPFLPHEIETEANVDRQAGDLFHAQSFIPGALPHQNYLATDDPDWLDAIGGGVLRMGQDVSQTAVTAVGGDPSKLPTIPLSKLDRPMTWEEASNNPSLAAKQALTMAIRMTPLVAGGLAGAAVSAPTRAAGAADIAGMVLGSSAGSMLTTAATSLGPRYAAALQKYPDNPDAAFEEALDATMVDVGASGLGGLIAGVPVFKSVLASTMAQMFGLQPLLGVANQYVTEGITGTDTGQTFADKYLGNVAPGVMQALGGATIPRHEAAVRDQDIPHFLDDVPELWTDRFTPEMKMQKDLLATHTLNEGSLDYADKKGGLAMPSIAIVGTKKTPARAVSGFGDIVLAGDQSIVDPATGAKVYGGDAYTPRYPKGRIGYRINQEGFDRAASILKEEGIKAHTSPKPNLTALQSYGVEGMIHHSPAFLKFAREHGIIPTDAIYNNQDMRLRHIQKSVKADPRWIPWLHKTFPDITAGEFILKGNKPSADHTLESVVDEMKSRQMRGGEGDYATIGRVKAELVPEFSSVDEIRSHYDDLASPTDYTTTYRKLDEDFNEIRSLLREKGSDTQKDGRIIRSILDVARGEDVRSAIVKNFGRATPEQVNAVEKFVANVAKAPSMYFEAKPQRAVGIGEFKAAALPLGQSKTLAGDILRKHGIDHLVEYETRDELSDRLAAFDALKFQNAQESIHPGDAPILRKTKPQMDDAQVRELTRGVEEIVKRIAGRTTNVRTAGRIYTQSREGGNVSAHRGVSVGRAIAVALHNESVTGTAKHESFHAVEFLRDAGVFKPYEWQALVDAAESKWIKDHAEFLKAYEGRPREEIVSEAIAQAANDVPERHANLPPLVRRALYKIRAAYERMRVLAKRVLGAKVTGDDIIRMLDAGAFAARADRIVYSAATGARYQIGPKTNLDDTIFQSAVKNALAETKLTRGHGSQWRAELVKAGARVEELRDTGLDDFLTENASKPLTRDEVAAAVKPYELHEIIATDGTKSLADVSREVVPAKVAAEKKITGPSIQALEFTDGQVPDFDALFSDFNDSDWVNDHINEMLNDGDYDTTDNPRNPYTYDADDRANYEVAIIEGEEFYDAIEQSFDQDEIEDSVKQYNDRKAVFFVVGEPSRPGPLELLANPDADTIYPVHKAYTTERYARKNGIDVDDIPADKIVTIETNYGDFEVVAQAEIFDRFTTEHEAEDFAVSNRKYATLYQSDSDGWVVKDGDGEIIEDGLTSRQAGRSAEERNEDHYQEWYDVAFAEAFHDFKHNREAYADLFVSWLTEHENLATIREDFRHSDAVREIMDVLRNAGGQSPSAPTRRDSTRFSTFTLPGGTHYREIILIQPGVSKFGDIPSHGFTAGSGDVVAHTRWKDFWHKDGGPALLIEEIQADSHQDASQTKKAVAEVLGEKVSGYGPDSADALLRARETLRKRIEEVGHFNIALINDASNLLEPYVRNEELPLDQSDTHAIGKILDNDLSAYISEPIKEAYYKAIAAGEGDAIEKLRERRSENKKSEQKYNDLHKRLNAARAMPKEMANKDSWYKVLFKRALHEAITKGYGYLTWTTGEQQAERYKAALQNAVKKITWEKAPDGNKNIIVELKDGDRQGRRTHNLQNVTQFETAQYVGQEVAAKIFDSDRGEMYEGDIKFANAGMVNFYSKALVKAANEIVKPFGLKVEMQTIVSAPGERTAHSHEVHGIKITPEARAKYVGNDPNKKSPLYRWQIDTHDGLRNADPRINTPEFLQFFRKSKVVDMFGAPLRMFHGTVRDFSEFKPGIADAFAGQGYYFTSHPDDASRNYASIHGPDLMNKIRLEADRRLSGDEYGEKDYDDYLAEVTAEMAEHGGQIMPVYLSIQNPLIIGGDRPTRLYGNTLRKLASKSKDVIQATIHDLTGHHANADYVNETGTELLHMTYDEDGSTAGDIANKLSRKLAWTDDYQDESGYGVANEIIRRLFESVGFDGVIDYGPKARWRPLFTGMDGPVTHVVAFHPNQIKSVFNRGTWSRRSNDIRYQVVGPNDISSGAFRSWFGKSIAVTSDGSPAIMYRHRDGHYGTQRDGDSGGSFYISVENPIFDSGPMRTMWDREASSRFANSMAFALQSIDNSIGDGGDMSIGIVRAARKLVALAKQVKPGDSVPAKDIVDKARDLISGLKIDKHFMPGADLVSNVLGAMQIDGEVIVGAPGGPKIKVYDKSKVRPTFTASTKNRSPRYPVVDEAPIESVEFIDALRDGFKTDGLRSRSGLYLSATPSDLERVYKADWLRLRYGATNLRQYVILREDQPIGRISGAIKGDAFEATWLGLLGGENGLSSDDIRVTGSLLRNVLPPDVKRITGLRKKRSVVEAPSKNSPSPKVKPTTVGRKTDPLRDYYQSMSLEN